MVRSLAVARVAANGKYLFYVPLRLGRCGSNLHRTVRYGAMLRSESDLAWSGLVWSGWLGLVLSGLVWCGRHGLTSFYACSTLVRGFGEELR